MGIVAFFIRIKYQPALSCWSHVPTYLNIEVKKKNVTEDPMVQLGIWVATEFMKRQLEGYDMECPSLRLKYRRMFEISGRLLQLWKTPL